MCNINTNFLFPALRLPPANFCVPTIAQAKIQLLLLLLLLQDLLVVTVAACFQLAFPFCINSDAHKAPALWEWPWWFLYPRPPAAGGAAQSVLHSSHLPRSSACSCSWLTNAIKPLVVAVNALTGLLLLGHHTQLLLLLLQLLLLRPL